MAKRYWFEVPEGPTCAGCVAFEDGFCLFFHTSLASLNSVFKYAVTYAATAEKCEACANAKDGTGYAGKG